MAEEAEKNVLLEFGFSNIGPVNTNEELEMSGARNDADGVIDVQPQQIPIVIRQNDISQGGSPTSSPSLGPRLWSTNLCDCLKDEETCWWGTWCCWILQARTAQSFSIDSSLPLIMKFWAFIFGFFIVLLVLRSPPITILYCFLGGSYLAYIRSSARQQIRERLGIIGEFSEDFCLHYCCSCCAVCQEAREAKAMKLKSLDYCSGEELSEAPHELAVVDSDSVIGGDLVSHLKTVSKTSKIIIMLSGSVAALSILVLLMVQSFLSIPVLLLVFIQPLVILYFVYWRRRRQYASLDYVIKIFAVGFWFTTFQSLVLEVVLQQILTILLFPALGDTSLTMLSDDDGGVPSHSPTASPAVAIGVFFYQNWINYIPATSNSEAFNLPAASSFAPEHSNRFLESTNSTGTSAVERETLKSHLFIVVIGLFILAYVIAAGVEETMKHFSVRCCRFPTPLKDPHTVLVYLMTGALGFATSENIEYVFGSASGVGATSLFLGELFVLFVRILMPIHVICSVLQASNFSRVIMGSARMSLFQVSQ